ncbi:Gamma-glutamyltranspeptidase precursor [Anatilimnocola aggregata]|uniref:Glutathione hydrolase proenzyme n=1 Tax=Anatilimnocola aggregata TaxID=2528021 RepID=A0A517YBQ9_9BACT|nr:gamma-glutamyltransferase [Anatilimnocola aggregata]QDU27680.1 Gamma-glutamyltranspeptidase precursor [Anatilimnocola aggregata]
MLTRRDLLRALAATSAGTLAANTFASLRAADTQTWQRGAVATVQPLATKAGVNALRQGGNAVDAAIAAAVTLGVVDQHNSGLGGGCFILIRQANGKLLAIDGRETAPAKASRDMYVRDGKAVPALSQTGPLAVATPGALAAYALALNKAGKLKLAEVVQPAADLAAKGFALDRNYARKLKSTADKLAQFPGSKGALLKADGTAYEEGETLKQPDLARTYQQIAKHGIDWFYRGEFAAMVEAWMKANGGILTAADFAAYQPIVREPLQTTYRDYRIIGFPPPSSGGVHVAQMLNMLEQFELADLNKQGRGALEHLLAEVMKLAFADRAYWLGDPDFANVPRGLIDKAYARELAAKIDLNKASEVKSYGRPPRATENIFAKPPADAPIIDKHTTHIAAADAEGNWVAITATVNTTFGSKIIVPGTGLVLNNEMDDFSISPGQPNAFGLIGAEANAVQPGKRPLSSMSPTIVLRDNQPFLTVGAAGGPTIITQVLQVLVRVLDLHQPLSEAVAAPRVHHQWRPDELRVEQSLPAATVAALQDRGHKIDATAGIGVCQAVSFDPATKAFTGVHDPRVPGSAEGL